MKLGKQTNKTNKTNKPESYVKRRMKFTWFSNSSWPCQICSGFLPTEGFGKQTKEKWCWREGGESRLMYSLKTILQVIYEEWWRGEADDWKEERYTEINPCGQAKSEAQGTLTCAGQLPSEEELLLTSPCVLWAVGGAGRRLGSHLPLGEVIDQPREQKKGWRVWKIWSFAGAGKAVKKTSAHLYPSPCQSWLGLLLGSLKNRAKL